MKEILKTFNMDDSKPIVTVVVTGVKLSKEDTTSEVNETWYRSMIGKL